MRRVLTPVAPPRVLEHVYTDDEYERLLGVVKRHGPWPTITAHHFETVDELIATTSGVVPKDHGLTLDDIATAHFRGFFAKNSVCFYPELEDIFYNHTFLDEVKSYWGAQYAKPTMMLFNICGPHHSGLNPHLDAVTFRGVRIENTPVWLQNIMAKSGSVHRLPREDGPGHHVVVPRRGRHVHLLARRAVAAAEATRHADVEPGRRRAERDDVPPRRSGRSPGGTRDRGPEAPLAASGTGPQTTTGSSRPTAT